MSFKDPDGMRNWTFLSVKDHGKDGNGATVYSGVSTNGWPSVFIVKDGKLIASSINDGSCNTPTDADEKAKYAVDHHLTSYWDSKQSKERYFNHHRAPLKQID